MLAMHRWKSLAFVLAVLLCVLLGLTLVAGCRSGESSDEQGSGQSTDGSQDQNGSGSASEPPDSQPPTSGSGSSVAGRLAMTTRPAGELNPGVAG